MPNFLPSSVMVPVTPKMAADMFWAMDCDKQAAFFNLLGELDSWSLAMQLQYLTDSDALSGKGRAVMSLIGDYSKKEV